jgi:hypothetical protein
MNTRLMVLSLVLLGFGALTGKALLEVGVQGIFWVLLGSPGGWQVFAGLSIAWILFLIGMRQDARERPLPFWSIAVLRLATGSFGPLLYLLLPEGRAQAAIR